MRTVGGALAARPCSLVGHRKGPVLFFLEVDHLHSQLDRLRSFVAIIKGEPYIRSYFTTSRLDVFSHRRAGIFLTLSHLPTVHYQDKGETRHKWGQMYPSIPNNPLSVGTKVASDNIGKLLPG